MAKKNLKLTNADLVTMNRALNQIPEKCTFKDPKKRPILFNIAVARNKREIKGFLQDLEELRKEPEGWEEYRKEDIELSKKHAVKDDNGNAMKEEIPIGPGRNMQKFIITGQDDPDSEYSKELKALKKKFNAEHMEKDFEQKLKDYEAAMKEETKFVPETVRQSEVPDDLPTPCWDGVIFMLNGSE